MKEKARAVFLNRRAASRYRALAPIIPGREGPEESTVRYKISLIKLITNLNVILYLSTCNAVYVSVLVLMYVCPCIIYEIDERYPLDATIYLLL